MSIFARSLTLASALAALCVGGPTAHAQVAAVPYSMANMALGFGGTVDPPASPDGNASGFDGSDGRGLSRTNFPSGWFMGNTRSDLGFSGFNRAAAFGSFSSLSTEGVQFGYNFKNSPVSIYAGFDSLKFNALPGTTGSSAFAAFDSRSGTMPGAFSTNAGIEYRPTSNLSLSVGVGMTQYSSGLVDSDINSPMLPGQTPLGIGGRPLR
jgi:hypothetical protein